MVTMARLGPHEKDAVICVWHENDWHIVGSGDPDTICGSFVPLPMRFETHIPTCTSCLTIFRKSLKGIK